MRQINRRNCLVGMTALCGALFTRAAWADGEPALEDTLKFGLRARRPIEFQFIAAVTKLTNEGSLPLAYVLAAFDYARRRRPHIPFPYFEVVVRRKAEELGVEIGVPFTLDVK
jgi:hypothetical protein